MQPGFSKKLEQRITLNQLRSFTNWEGKIDFFSNDYLGVARKKLTSEVEGDFVGSTGSRLLSGNHSAHESLETNLAQFFKAESVLLFNSGYDANLGLFSALPQKNETVFYDQKIHASIRDGLRLSNCQSVKFKHNNFNDLNEKLKACSCVKFVVIESIYSMDGDASPIEKIYATCKENGAILIIDEAHSVGVFGDGGIGMSAFLSDKKDVIRVITFGKAFGSHGAAVLGSSEVINYLMNFARSFIYTTAISLEAVSRIHSVLKWMVSADQERTLLRNTIEYFKLKMEEMQFSSNDSPIQFIPLDSIDWEQLSIDFDKNNIAIKAIFPPTVAVGEERLRISLHSFNTKNEIDILVDLIKNNRNA